MQDHPWQKECIVEDRRRLEVMRQEPAHLEDMLMQPALNPAEQDEQSGNQQYLSDQS